MAPSTRAATIPVTYAVAAAIGGQLQHRHPPRQADPRRARPERSRRSSAARPVAPSTANATRRRRSARRRPGPAVAGRCRRACSARAGSTTPARTAANRPQATPIPSIRSPRPAQSRQVEDQRQPDEREHDPDHRRRRGQPASGQALPGDHEHESEVLQQQGHADREVLDGVEEGELGHGDRPHAVARGPGATPRAGGASGRRSARTVGTARIRAAPAIRRKTTEPGRPAGLEQGLGERAGGGERRRREERDQDAGAGPAWTSWTSFTTCQEQNIWTPVTLGVSDVRSQRDFCP